MSSITSVNIAHAAATATSNPLAQTQSQKTDALAGHNPHTIAAISQIAAAKASDELGEEENTRAVQVEIRSEGSFSPNQDEEHRQKEDRDVTEKEETAFHRSGHKLDVTA